MRRFFPEKASTLARGILDELIKVCTIFGWQAQHSLLLRATLYSKAMVLSIS